MRARGLFRNTRGAAAVEFAFSLPILLGFLGLLFDGGRLYYTRNTVQNAIDQVGRSLMIDTTMTNTQIQTLVNAALSPHGITISTCSVTSSTTGGVTFKTISVTVPYSTLLLNMISSSGITSVTASSRVPVIS